MSSVGPVSGSTSSSMQQRSGIPPRLKEDFTSALKSAGVDDSKIPELLSQIEAAFNNSSDGTPEDIHNAINSILENNGVDVQKFEASIQSLRKKESTQRTEGGRPSSPPSKSDFESALKNAGVNEADIPDLLNTILRTISNLKSNEDDSGKENSIRESINSILKDNGVDVDKFENSLRTQQIENGNFVDVTA
jgi:hypothetical protein